MFIAAHTPPLALFYLRDRDNNWFGYGFFAVHVYYKEYLFQIITLIWNRTILRQESSKI